MASGIQRLVQDQSQNVHPRAFAFGGKKTNVLQAHRKGTLVEKIEKTRTRKPLQELNRNNSENLVSIEGDTGKSKAKTIAQKTLNGARKPLGDLTNSNKPRLKSSSSENVTGKLFCQNTQEMQPNSAMEEECYLHDHNECIKAQRHTMGFDYFLEIVGLRKDCSVAVVTPQLVPIVSSTLKLETPMKYRELDETMMIEAGSESPPLSPPISSPTWKMDLKNLEFSSLKLKETPAIQKLSASPP
ncbi:hypothetical protein Ancab_009189 [Ancistrocladus abbreviatus]